MLLTHDVFCFTHHYFWLTHVDSPKNTGKSYEIPIFHGLSYQQKWKILLNPHFPWVKLTFLLGQNPRKIPPAAPQVLLLLSHARSNHLGILRQQ
jgi:hypothetical protein